MRLSDEEILIENLRPSTTYLFQVSSRNEVGVSPPREFMHNMPAVEEPYPIVIVSDPYGLYPFEYTLLWEKPRTGGVPIEEYQFSYRKVSALEGNRKVSGVYPAACVKRRGNSTLIDSAGFN